MTDAAVGRGRTIEETTTCARPSTLQVAHRLLGLGLSVIPVPRPRPGVPQGMPGDGKVPALAWGRYQTELPRKRDIDKWFGGEPMNLAVITGAISGVVVIDADERAGLRWLVQKLPYTPWQTQTSKGFHLWYRHPGVPVPNRARISTPDGRLKIDVRGDGGFVIAPGSVHASGAEYLEAGDWSEPRERVPVFWPGWLARPQRQALPAPTPRHTGDGDHLLERARAYVAKVPPAIEGQGGDLHTFQLAAKLVRGFALSDADAFDLLRVWNQGCQPPWTDRELEEKIRGAGKYGVEPIGALR